MNNRIRLKCYKCRKSFKVSLRDIEFLQVEKCPYCGHLLTEKEKIDLYHAVYFSLKNSTHSIA